MAVLWNMLRALDPTDAGQLKIFESVLSRPKTIYRTSYKAHIVRMDTYIIKHPELECDIPHNFAARQIQKTRNHIAAKMAHHTMRMGAAL